LNLAKGEAKVPAAAAIPDPLRMASRLERPIQDMSWLEASFLFAELSRLAYFDDHEIVDLVAKAGIPEIEFVDRDGAQAYILKSVTDCIIVCRGTEPHEWNDLRADANALTVLTEIGRLHAGFNREVDDLWPILVQRIEENRLPMWFAGHSLGGAMATICAGRCKLSKIPSNPSAIFTFGSPRVGNKKYINYVKIPHYRWVNNNDIVARVPPALLGYRHSGNEIYIDSDGHVRFLTYWERVRDSLRGVALALRMGKVDYFGDHSMLRYIEHIDQALTMERSGRLPASIANQLPKLRAV
jgi:triacylglycerol lipase